MSNETGLIRYKPRTLRLIGSTADFAGPLRLDESHFAEALSAQRKLMDRFIRSLGIPVRLLGEPSQRLDVVA